jgi:hypothetical protein
MAALKTSLNSIGNEQGTCTPKAIAEQPHMRPVKKVREGWAKAAKTMHEASEDELLLSEASNKFDDEEWAW